MSGSLQEDLGHHGDHDALPPFADKRNRAVKIKKGGTHPAALQVGGNDLDIPGMVGSMFNVISSTSFYEIVS